MSADYYQRTTCRMCGESELERVMTLTPTPPGNRLLRKDELEKPETKYPLELFFCNSCTHVQLGHVVDPRILYQRDYLYVSGTSSQFVRHLEKYASDMVARFHLGPDSLVADIGSNDGTCLRAFKTHGVKVVGVDPAENIARTATESGIETVADFFSLALAKKLREQYGPASLVTSHNACAHIDNLDDIFRGAAHWLDDNGVFVVEVGYFVDVFTKRYFDTIYHEHLDYHTVAPFRRLLARTGMELISVERILPQGGSIRVIAQKKGGPLAVDASVNQLIQLEHELGLDKASTLTEFGEMIGEVGRKLRALIDSVKANGKRIAGFGAPTKAVTLVTHFGITAQDVEFIVEDNPLKPGLFLPVAHIPVVATEEIYLRQPDFLLILAWNFAEPIMAAHKRFTDAGGRFMVPLPEPKIV